MLSTMSVLSMNDKSYKERMLDVFPSYRKDFIYTDSLVQYMYHLTKGHKFPLRLPARLPYDPSTMCTHVNDPVELAKCVQT